MSDADYSTPEKSVRRLAHLAATMRGDGDYADGFADGLQVAVDVLNGADPLDVIDRIMKETP